MRVSGSGEMTPALRRGAPEPGLLGLLSGAALIAVIAGAVGSLGLMLYAGRRNPSLLLVALFAIWVLSPSMALVVAHRVSKQWSTPTRATVYCVMLALALGALAIYGGLAFGRLRAKTGFVFLIVPLASWLLVAIVVPMAALISGRLLRQGDGS
jgi:hypothetical protein